jgi:hypothetical protein
MYHMPIFVTWMYVARDVERHVDSHACVDNDTINTINTLLSRIFIDPSQLSLKESSLLSWDKSDISP